MPADVINGKVIASEIRQSVSDQITSRLNQGQKRPCLAVILVGDNPASQIYVSHKEKACRAVGIESITVKMPAQSTQVEVAQEIHRLNCDDNVDGILLQLPLPKHLQREPLIEQVSPDKDVDGLTPVNQGRLCWRQPGLYPCTPLGIMELIKRTGISLPGKVAAVVGRSNLVGMPVGILLEISGCTIIGLHSESVNISEFTRKADILVAATGVPELVRKDWIKPGAIVIDVGTTRVGSKLVGDVAFSEVSEVASQITPVPGGVGPMTIAMLVQNCLKACELRQRSKAYSGWMRSESS